MLYVLIFGWFLLISYVFMLLFIGGTRWDLVVVPPRFVLYLDCVGGLAFTLDEDRKEPITQLLKLTGRKLSFCLAGLKTQSKLMARLKIANEILKRKNVGELIESNDELKQEFIQLCNDLGKRIQHSLDVVDRYDEKCEKIRTAKLERQGDVLAKQLKGTSAEVPFLL